ncbi:MAG: hypothetical protein JWM65_2459 [Sphingomonas bacterium]|nr:hypothetical protein [Sphingomonas bacterium]
MLHRTESEAATGMPARQAFDRQTRKELAYSIEYRIFFYMLYGGASLLADSARTGRRDSRETRAGHR